MSHHEVRNVSQDDMKKPRSVKYGVSDAATFRTTCPVCTAGPRQDCHSHGWTRKLGGNAMHAGRYIAAAKTHKAGKTTGVERSMSTPLIDLICPHCDGDGCEHCHEGWVIRSRIIEIEVVS